MSSRIDKTKQNLGIGNLDEGSRKELFEKFKDAGGEVVSDRDERRKGTIQREKDSRRPSTSSRTISPDQKRKSSSEIKGTARRPTPATSIPGVEVQPGSSFLDRMFLRLKLVFSKTASFDQRFLHDKFLRALNDHASPAMMEIQIIYYELLRNNPAIRDAIITSIDRINPLYYELIEMSGSLYDKMAMDEILHHYRNFPEIPLPATDLKNQFLQLFRKLYVLKPYEGTILFAFERAIDQAIETTGKKTPKLSAMKRKVRTELSVIFSEFYPRLHLLFCLYEKRWFNEESLTIGALLKITEDERPGKRTHNDEGQNQSDELTSSENDAETEAEKNDKILNDLQRKGMEMMYTVNIPESRKRFDRNNLYNLLPDSDKVFLSYIFFKEFDAEYSTILTNSQVKFRSDFGNDGSRTDYRVKLSDLYNEMRTGYRSIDVYHEEYLLYEKAKKQRPNNNTQYMAYTKNLENLKRKLLTTGKSTRMLLLDFFTRISKVLNEINEDINGPQRYIENPQDELDFNTQIEGIKKLHKKKIYDAFYLVQAYAAAFEYRLGSMGDLGGISLGADDSSSQVESDESNAKTDNPADDSLNDLI